MYNYTLTGNITNATCGTITTVGFECNVTPVGTGCFTLAYSGLTITQNQEFQVRNNRVYPNRSNYARQFTVGSCGTNYGVWTCYWGGTVPETGYNQVLQTGLRKIMFKDFATEPSGTNTMGALWEGVGTNLWSIGIGSGTYPWNTMTGWKGKGYRHIADTLGGMSARKYTKDNGALAWWNTDQNVTSRRKANQYDLHIHTDYMPPPPGGVYFGYMIVHNGSTSGFGLTDGYRVLLNLDSIYLQRYDSGAGTWSMLASTTMPCNSTVNEFWVRVVYNPADIKVNGGLSLMGGTHKITVDKYEKCLGSGVWKNLRYTEYANLSSSQTYRLMLGLDQPGYAEFDCITYSDDFYAPPECVKLHSSLKHRVTDLEAYWPDGVNADTYFWPGDTIELWTSHQYETRTANMTPTGMQIEAVRMFDGVVKRYTENEDAQVYGIYAVDERASALNKQGVFTIPNVSYYYDWMVGGTFPESPPVAPTWGQSIYQRMSQGFSFIQHHFNVTVSGTWTWLGSERRMHRLVEVINGLCSYWSSYGFMHYSKGTQYTPVIFEQNTTYSTVVPMTVNIAKKANYVNGHINMLRVYHQPVAGGTNVTATQFVNTTDIATYRGVAGLSEVWPELPNMEGILYATKLWQMQNNTFPIVEVQVVKYGYDVWPGQRVELHSVDSRLNGTYAIIDKKYYYSNRPGKYTNKLLPCTVSFLCVPWLTSNGSNLPMEDTEGDKVLNTLNDNERMKHLWI